MTLVEFILALAKIVAWPIAVAYSVFFLSAALSDYAEFRYGRSDEQSADPAQE